MCTNVEAWVDDRSKEKWPGTGPQRPGLVCPAKCLGRTEAGVRKTTLLRVGDQLQRGQDGEEGTIREGRALMRTDPGQDLPAKEEPGPL